MSVALLRFLLLAVPSAPTPASEEKGLWVGPIRLCSDTVEELAWIERPQGDGEMVITLSESIQPRLADETRRRVGEEMTIRIDGRILSAPTVLEPILGLQLEVRPITAADAAAAERAATGPCV